MRTFVGSVVAMAMTVAGLGCTDDAGDRGAGATVVASGQCELEPDEPSMYRVWNEAALDAVRLDFPAPTVHARNLYHLAAAMWEAWLAFDRSAGRSAFEIPIVDEAQADDIATARNDAIAFAAHRLLTHRYQLSTSRRETTQALDDTLAGVCAVDDGASFVADHPDSAAALGVAIADGVIQSTIDDGSLEREAYEDPSYVPSNPPLVVSEPGTELIDPDHWQPLLLTEARSQNGLPLPGGEQSSIGSHWGEVRGFALADRHDDEATAPPIEDPGPPPRITDDDTADRYRQQALEVVRASADLEVGAARIDIGPGAVGNNSLGVDDGRGHDLNPATGEPYAANDVDAADYYRSIAEYWADGPHSETPPGHWNTIMNAVNDALDPADLRIGGDGAPVNRLEWDVKLGLAVNGALHDAAISAWGIKAFYDSVRPISMIRWLGGNGAYDEVDNPDGIPLEDGLVEVITPESSAPGARHEQLADHVGDVAIRAWTGSPDDPEREVAGVDWIRAVEWVPYQRSTFVTPAFPSFVSGHSTFSRAAAEVLAGLTGSEFFPGGLYSHEIEAGSLLHEDGPSEDLTLQWGTYFDASDEAGRSRIWGGIHISADDESGRRVGRAVGRNALDHALDLYAGGDRGG